MSGVAAIGALFVTFASPPGRRRRGRRAGCGAVGRGGGGRGARGRGARVSDDRLSPEIRRVAIVVIVGAIMSILDTTIVNVALESLSRDLNAPLSTIQWVATGYLLVARDGHPAHRVGRRALRAAARVDDGRRRRSS